MIEYRNGNDDAIRKRPGRIKVGNISLKRGYADNACSELWDWWAMVMKGEVERRSGSIILCNDHGKEVCRYDFTEAWPIKWKGWDLEGSGTTNAIEEIEICCETLQRKWTGN